MSDLTFRKQFRITIRFLIGFAIWTTCVYKHYNHRPDHEHDLYTARYWACSQRALHSQVLKIIFFFFFFWGGGRIAIQNAPFWRFIAKTWFWNGFRNMIRSSGTGPSGTSFSTRGWELLSRSFMIEKGIYSAGTSFSTFWNLDSWCCWFPNATF